MPKDFTHWTVAEEITNSKEFHASIFKAAQEHPGLVIKGAVFPDILYYYKKGNCYINSVADQMHGPGGEDTFDVLRRLLRKLFGILKEIGQNQGNEESKRKSERKRDYLLAFIVGVVTHIFADANFHPMVYHLTGNYYDCVSSKKTRAIIRHRTLECIIDLYFSDGYRHLSRYEETVKEWKEEYNFLFEELDFVFRDTNTDPVTIFRDAYRDLSDIRKYILGHKFLCKFLHWVDFLLPSSLRKKVAVSYSTTLMRYVPEFSQTIAFQNPITGEEFNLSLEDLKNKAKHESIDFCLNHLEKYIEKQDSDIAERGPSLESGIINGNVANMRYFNIFKF